nr:hypothetical protein Iba_chr04dCG12860 [Ipomoea batatas]
MLLLGQQWWVLCLKGALTRPDSFAVTIASYTFQGFWGALFSTGHKFSTAVHYMAACASIMVFQAFSACKLILEGGCRLKAIDLGIPSNFSLLLDSIDAKSGNPFALEFNLVSDEKDET